jgi:hypothetical protein
LRFPPFLEVCVIGWRTFRQGWRGYYFQQGKNHPGKGGTTVPCPAREPDGSFDGRGKGGEIREEDEGREQDRQAPR